MPDAPSSFFLPAPAVCLGQPAAFQRAEPRRRVPGTRLGHWSLGIRVWTRFVAEVALHAFVRLLPAGYQRLVRHTGFESGPEHVATATPFWARPDCGLTRRLGWRRLRPDDQPTGVTIVAFQAGRPA